MLFQHCFSVASLVLPPSGFLGVIARITGGHISKVAIPAYFIRFTPLILER
jgi:hypothetical protein